MTASFLLMGFLLGVRHALDADHIAAVASLATRESSARGLLRMAMSWGTGHALAILVVGCAAVALGTTVPAGMEQMLERCVGVVLALLGVDVLRRVLTRRVHAHVHWHDGERHVHVHAHEDEEEHATNRHGHFHPPVGRSMAVGTLHGLAGSAPLVLLAASGTGSGAQAITCLATFGAGSILGMLLFSLALSLPLRIAARPGLATAGMETALGVATIVIGIGMIAT